MEIDYSLASVNPVVDGCNDRELERLQVVGVPEAKVADKKNGQASDKVDTKGAHNSSHSSGAAVEKTKEKPNVEYRDESPKEKEGGTMSSLSAMAFRKGFDSKLQSSPLGATETSSIHKLPKVDDSKFGSENSPSNKPTPELENTPEFIAGINSDSFKRAFNKRVEGDKLLKLGESDQGSSETPQTGITSTDSDIGFGSDVFRKEFNRKIDADLGFTDPQAEISELGGLNSDEFKRSFSEAVGADELLSGTDITEDGDRERSLDGDDGWDSDERYGSDNYFDDIDKYLDDYDYDQQDWEDNLDAFNDSESEFEDFLSFDEWEPDFVEDYYAYELSFLEQEREERQQERSQEEDQAEERTALLQGGYMNPDTIKDESVRVAYESREKEHLAERLGVGVIGENRLATEYENPIVGSHIDDGRKKEQIS